MSKCPTRLPLDLPTCPMHLSIHLTCQPVPPINLPHLPMSIYLTCPPVSLPQLPTYTPTALALAQLPTTNFPTSPVHISNLPTLELASLHISIPLLPTLDSPPPAYHLLPTSSFSYTPPVLTQIPPPQPHCANGGGRERLFVLVIVIGPNSYLSPINFNY